VARSLNTVVQAEGQIALACLYAEQRNLLLMKHKEGVRVSDLAREYGVTRATIYKYLAEKVA